MITLLLWTLALILILVGLAGLVLPALPGPLLVFAGLWMAAWIEGFEHVGTWSLILIGVLSALAMLVDFVAGALGAQRYGASSRSIMGATLGAIVGMFFGLPGLILGPFIGAMIGELTARPDLYAAGRAGWGATIGLILGTAAKLSLGLSMVAVFLVARFF